MGWVIRNWKKGGGDGYGRRGGRDLWKNRGGGVSYGRRGEERVMKEEGSSAKIKNFQ